MQHKIIFAFLLLKGTFVTWQVGRERLLGTSNESLISKKQINDERAVTEMSYLGQVVGSNSQRVVLPCNFNYTVYCCVVS
jgi:hypothetical protein